MAVSAAPLKICTCLYDRTMSYETLHSLNNRATPNQFCTYRHALLLHKVYNNQNPNNDTIDLYFNQQFNNCCRTVKFVDTRSYKIGKNILSNQLVILNGKINLEWLNLPFESYKIKCKNLLLWADKPGVIWEGINELFKFKVEVHPKPSGSIND